MLGPISLGSLKYNNKLFQKFFSSISVRKHLLYGGTKVYTANTYLQNKFIPDWKPINYLYSTCDGSGTSKFENLAIYKSISEAFERLAFYQNFDSTIYGFDIDCSTNGMAAFPGISRSSARAIAFEEAVERWSLSAFWRGSLSIQKIEHIESITYLYFRTPFSKISFLISYTDIELHGEKPPLNSFRAYGFAAGKNSTSVKFRANVELSRNVEILEAWIKKGRTSLLSNIEKKLTFFAEEKGIRAFDERVEYSQRNNLITLKAPDILIDREVTGIWTPHCHVYRVLFDGMKTDSSKNDEFSF